MSVNSFENYPLTWKPDKESIRRPYYKYLADDLEQNIRSGLLGPGTKLPPQREIADYLEVNLSTITKVYDICKKKGLLMGTVGRGTFVAGRLPGDYTLPIPENKSDVIDLSALSNFSERCTPAVNALKRITESHIFPEMFSYDYPMGMPHQLAAGTRWMEMMGVHTDIEHTVIVSGGQNALMVTLLALFSPGDCIAVDAFTYASFIEMAKMFHIQLAAVETDDEGMIPEDFQRVCRNNTIHGVYLMPSCTNPTTVVMSDRRRDAIGAIIEKEKLILIEDDIASWMHAAAGVSQHSLFDRLSERCVYICGMSKSLCPGVRVAFLTFKEDLKTAIQKALFNLNVKTSSLDAEIITELLNSGEALRVVREKQEACQMANTVYNECFGQENANSGMCFFRWLPLPSEKSENQVEEELLECGVRVFHSNRFTPDAKNRGAYLRISLGSAGNLKRLRQALRIVKAYCDSENTDN